MQISKIIKVTLTVLNEACIQGRAIKKFIFKVILYAVINLTQNSHYFIYFINILTETMELKKIMEIPIIIIYKETRYTLRYGP